MADATLTTRRAFLTSAAVAPALAIPVAIAMPAPDPIFALIEEHAHALKALDDLDAAGVAESHLTFKAADEREFWAWRNLMQIRPTTLEGAKAYARYIVDHRGVETLTGCYGPHKALIQLAETLASL